MPPQPLRQRAHDGLVLRAVAQENIVFEVVRHIRLAHQNGTSSASGALFGSGTPIAEQTRETTPVGLNTWAFSLQARCIRAFSSSAKSFTAEITLLRCIALLY